MCAGLAERLPGRASIDQGGILRIEVSGKADSLGDEIVIVHPQTVFDQAELGRLRSVRATTHVALANNLKAYLDRHNPAPVAGRNVAGFALMTRIWGDRPQDVSTAVSSLMNHCNAVWSNDHDLNQAEDVLNGAIGYDVLFNLLTVAQRNTCVSRLAASAKDLADAGDAGEWWNTDLVNNHNWVNYASIGIAGQALEGEDANATHWRDIARTNFQKVKAVQDLITDGSWHEGIGYMEFGIGRSIAYWLGAVRRGISDDKSRMLSNVGRYILYAQLPNQPRVHVMTHGDFNWSRPGLIAVLRWVARRFQDSYAQEAASRWDLDSRLTRQEFGLDYALEYCAYDPSVAIPDMGKVPLDLYNEDQQSVILRSGWSYGKISPSSDPLLVGFKAGVFGGRGNYERVRSCAYPGGILNFSHDHEDDLGLWIYGKGGWLLPEAVAYNCCYTNTSEYQSTSWHNTFLIDGTGQLGDDKTVSNQTGKSCGTVTPTWFYDREASMPLHESTDHYAFARADGRRLYPSMLGIGKLLRTVGLSRESDGFVALQDRVVLGVARKVEQILHSMDPSGTNDASHPWVRLTNLNGSVLGVRVISPIPYTANISTQISNNFQENMDDDGRFGYVKIAPTAPVANLTFLEVLWPTKAGDWANRPGVVPLDTSGPERGFVIQLGSAEERWIYNTAAMTSAQDLALRGGEIGITRTEAAGALQRLVLLGQGSLTDQNNARLLVANPGAGVVEVAFSGTRADLSGSQFQGVQFFGPSVTEVRADGQQVAWTRQGDTVTVEQGGNGMRIGGGSTLKGQTAWQTYAVGGTSYGIYVDVDTSSSGFTKTPSYVTSLGGDSRHWATTGGSSVYAARTTGFRIYVRWVDNTTPPTPQSADADGWHVNWIGYET
jgi:Domain of unknown function (DUF4962)